MLFSGILVFPGEFPIEGWQLNDSGTGDQLASIVQMTQANHQWGVWLKNNTFGRSLDFSTDGSYAVAKNSKANMNGEFTLSLWLKAPPREKHDRVAFMLGAANGPCHKLFLNADCNFELDYHADGVAGLESSGISLADGKWHHVLISRSGNILSYYIDGNNVKTLEVTGQSACTSGDVYIGAGNTGANGFDGTLAEIRFFGSALLPEQATLTVLDSRDNEQQQPRMGIKKGLVFDRRQYHSPEPGQHEGQTVRAQDVYNAKMMGFDHVKLLLTPNHLIDEDGSFKRENMFYIDRVIQYVADNNYRCILCLHPEKDFKPTYLNSLDNFEILIKWYGEFAKYIGSKWGPDLVAIQLMTEPGMNDESVEWSWMSDRMWGAVRNVLPDHTIITSSDRWGNLERLKTMSPTSDSNLIYSFTTYEPYIIGWYFFNPSPHPMSPWGYVKDIPYPVQEGVDYTLAIENAIEGVPENKKAAVRESISEYVQGKWDGEHKNFPNNYPSLYNAEWHRLRAKSLDDWRQKYGGNIHIMCVEFGCMDRLTPQKLWRSSVEGAGIPPGDRVQFIHDMRSAFDEFNIGWSYWSYNEAFTVFLPEKHVYGISPTPEEAEVMLDWDMLEIGLGVTPLVKKTGTKE